MQRPIIALSLTRLAIFLALVTVPQTWVCGQTELKWKWSQGRRLQVRYQQTIDNETNVNRVPIAMNIAMDMDMTWRVVDVDSEGNATVQQTIDRLTLKLQSPDKPPVEYDSRQRRHSSAGRIIHESVGALIGAPFQMEVTDRGDVTNVQWTKEAEDAVAKARQNSQLASLVTKESLADMIRKSVPKLPAKSIKVGDQWSREDRFSSAFGEMLQTSTFEFSGSKETIHDFSIKGQLKVEKPKAEAKGKLTSQSLSGSFTFDNSLGVVKGSRVEQELTSERPYRGTVIGVKTKTVLAMTISPAEANDTNPKTENR